MRLLRSYLALSRMYRARWHRQQHVRLMDLVADYLEALPHD